MRIFILFLLLFLSSSVFSQLEMHGRRGMVVSEQKLASQVGGKILQSGGNAIDAAVAVGYALAVTDPCCGNIGGGGFALVHLANGKNLFLNFREKAPLKLTQAAFKGDAQQISQASTQGYLAVGVPGTVLGLDTLLKKYGTKSREEVMAPAIQLARAGFKITPYEHDLMSKFTADFKAQANIASIFLFNDKPRLPGTLLRQKALSQTLQTIADKGSRVFYQGEIAKKIVVASQAHGGLLTLSDFANYTVEWQPPIRCHYRGYTIISAPPPSSGGVTLCEMLGILENLPKQKPYHGVLDTQRLIETMRYAFVDRNQKLGDPDFVKNPIEKLLSPSYQKKISEKIRQTKQAPKEIGVHAYPESTDTTHFSIVDRQGNIVSLTYTLNGFYGARVMADQTGFFLNNEIDDFATQPGKANKFGLVQYDANAIEPGKRPLSSMTPTIVLKNNKPYLVLGSPGGPRIITSVLLALLGVIDHEETLQQAVDHPRFHFQDSPDVVAMEAHALSAQTQLGLKKRGYHFEVDPHWGAVAGIMIKDKELIGVMDRRRPYGAAVSG